MKLFVNVIRIGVLDKNPPDLIKKVSLEIKAQTELQKQTE